MNREERNIAIDTAVRRERRRLLDFIRLRVGSDEDAEDILQDVFYQMAATYSVTEPIERLAAWLFTVARNKIIDRYRKKKPEVMTRYAEKGDDDDDSMLDDLEDLLFDPAGAPDEVYTRALFWEELADALDELPAQQREVFVMHELEGRSFKEIADITGVQVATLLSRKRYAVIFLRDRLRGTYDEL